MAIQHCTFRYLHDCHAVYYIARRSKFRQSSFVNSEYYSEPFHGTEKPTSARNALLAFVDKDMCRGKVATIARDAMSVEIDICHVPMEQFRDMALYFKMPALVITTAFCDIADRSEHLEAHYIAAPSEPSSSPRVKQ